MSENLNNYQVNDVGQRANEELEAFAMQVDDDPLKLLEDRVDVIEKTPFVAEILNGKESEEGVGDEVEMEVSEKTTFVSNILNESEEEEEENVSIEENEVEEFENWQENCFSMLEVDKEMREAKNFQTTSEGLIYIVIQIQQLQAIATKKPTKRQNWPVFISIPNDLFPGDHQPTVGDEIRVTKFSWRPGYEELAMENEPNNKKLRPWINVGFINAQAVATEIIVTYPMHVGRVGQVVQLHAVSLTRPNEWKVSPQWVLPLECPFGSLTERKAHQPLVATGILNENMNYNFPPRSNNSWDELEQTELVIAAAITACADRMETEIQRFTIITELQVLPGPCPVGTANVRIQHLVEKKEDLVDMTKLWREDQPIHIKLAAPGTKHCGTGYIINTERQEGEVGFVLVSYLFLAFQEARNYDGWEDWERIMSGSLTELEPLQSQRTLLQRARKFAMAQRAEQSAPESTWEELLVAHNPVLNNLVGDQRRTAQLMLDAQPRVVFMQAPPGTGKTKTSADIIAAYLRENPEARALVIAPLNVAVAKAVEEMARAMERTGWREEMLALFSGSGKQKYAQELERIGDHLLASAISAPQLFETLDDQQKNVVNRYVKACEVSPRTANEGKVAQLLLSKEKRRLIFCTLALAEQIGGIFEDTTMVVCDEGGQAPFSQLLSALTNFPKLTKLLIAGDRRQLSVHLEEFPEAVRNGLGLDTIIWNLDMSPGVDKTTLETNYRSHPALTECIQAGAYAAHGERLTTGRTLAEMDRLITQTPIKLPHKNSPLVLIHQTDPMIQDPTSFSATNPEMTRTVMDFIGNVRPRFTGSIRIICFYAGQAKELGMAVANLELEDVIVNTADACQGHESDLAVVVTTKAGLTTLDGSNAFWNDERRVNVALSRGRYGLVVVGDMKMLWTAGGIWRRFLRSALNKTTVVTPDYIEAMVDNNAEYNNNIL
uniref:DNA2/NAM7 helicase-like C-terminal domain-containing protein n=1 Tax=Meloidogyne javanica TaxID=6303 RepID=A0A915LMP0_MELJA